LKKTSIFILLFISYVSYSSWVYTEGTSTASEMSLPAEHGKEIWQKNNCTSCHQLFGMGGYLGPDLTTVISDPLRGPAYAKAFLQNGGSRMPNFKFTEDEINAVLAYLQYVDSNASTYKNKDTK